MDIAFLKEDAADVRRRAVEVRREAQVRLAQLRVRVEQELKLDAPHLLTPTGHEGVDFMNVKRTHDENIAFYLHFPYLFYEVFPDVALEHYDALAISNWLYLNYVLVMDRLMDGKVMLEPGIAYWVTSAYQKITRLLASLFPLDSPFWQYFEACRRENGQALLLERVKHAYQIAPYSEGEMVSIFAGKSALAKAGIAALAFLHDETVPESLIASCEAFHVGLQLLDNLEDWRSDYRDHLYTPLLTQVILDQQLEAQVEIPERLDVNAIGSLLYMRGYARATLAEAVDYFQLALHYVREVSCPGWQMTIERMLQGCQNHDQALQTKIQQIKQKPHTAATVSPVEPTPPPSWRVSALYDSTSAGRDGTRAAEILREFWHAADVSIEIAQANLEQIPAQATTRLPPVADLAAPCSSTLAHCYQLAPLSQPVSVYLLLSGGDRAESASFLNNGEWGIAIALDRWAESPPASIDFISHFIQIKTAYEYGRLLRLAHSQPPTNLLEQLCMEGLALAFAAEVCPDMPWEELAEMPPGAWTWFERNKHYLWQEVQGLLASSVPAVTQFYLARSQARTRSEPGVGRLLGYDMVAGYRWRIGKQPWQKLMQVSATDILNKGTAMAIAARISGRTEVRFDL